jgi:hypothetical protein
MKITDLLNQIRTRKSKLQAEKVEAYNYFLSEAQKIARANIEKWFGALAHDFTFVSSGFSSGSILDIDDYERITLIQKLEWNGIEVRIHIPFVKLASPSHTKNPSVIEFRFNTIELYRQTLQHRNFDYILPTNSFESVSDTQWKYFVASEQIIDNEDFQNVLDEAFAHEQQRNEIIVRQDDAEVQAVLENFQDKMRLVANAEKVYRDFVNEHPTLQPRFKDLLVIEEKEREQVLSDKKAHEAEENRLKNLESAELERLKKICHRDFRPFILFRIHYGAHLEREYLDDDNDEYETNVYTEDFYTTTELPDNDGYYKVIRASEVFQEKAQHRYRVQKILVKTFEDLDKNFQSWAIPFRRETVTSAVFPNVSFRKFVIPEDLGLTYLA